jgi:hypothetical protein
MQSAKTMKSVLDHANGKGFMKAHRALIMTIAITTMIVASNSQVSAQDVAVGQATATVQTILSISATASLAFGTVYQGIPKTIAKNTASSGAFAISGQALSGISIFMQLPEYMATSTGDDRMPTAFSTTDATVDSTGNANPATPGAGGWPNVNPRNLPTTTVLGGGGSTYIFLGGKVLPSPNQKAGAYTGDIIVTVAYTGS